MLKAVNAMLPPVKLVPLIGTGKPVVATGPSTLAVKPPAPSCLVVPAPVVGYTCVSHTLLVVHATGAVPAESLVQRNSRKAAPLVAVALGALVSSSELGLAVEATV